MDLKDKVAIVTGGARGIGAGIAARLASDGARVAIIDIDGAEAEAAAESLGGDALGLAADASRESDIADATAGVVEQFGGLDILVNNAGGGSPDAMQSLASMGSPFTRITEEGWDEQLARNLRTTFATTKAAIPYLTARGAGSIVNIASIAGLIPTATLPAYGAAKAGVISLTRSLALELAADGVRVNAICPGLVWTRAWEQLASMMKVSVPALKHLEPREIFLAQVSRSIPLGTEQTPDDIADLTSFLCSDLARNITGQAITVDGGLTLRVGA